MNATFLKIMSIDMLTPATTVISIHEVASKISTLINAGSIKDPIRSIASLELHHRSGPAQEGGITLHA